LLRHIEISQVKINIVELVIDLRSFGFHCGYQSGAQDQEVYIGINYNVIKLISGASLGCHFAWIDAYGDTVEVPAAHATSCEISEWSLRFDHAE
jgi:hypothetical protein